MVVCFLFGIVWTMPRTVYVLFTGVLDGKVWEAPKYHNLESCSFICYVVDLEREKCYDL